MAAFSSHQIKIDFYGDVRLFRLKKATYQELVRTMQERFLLSNPSYLQLLYDLEGETRPIINDHTLAEALALFQQQGHTLRLRLVTSTSPLYFDLADGTPGRIEEGHHHLHSRGRPDEEEADFNYSNLPEIPSTSLFPYTEQEEEEEQKEQAAIVQHHHTLLHHQQQQQQQQEEEQHHRQQEEGNLLTINSNNISNNQNNSNHTSLVIDNNKLIWATCHYCQRGIETTEIRYKCYDCPDFDLCVSCEARAIHDPTHGLIKLRPQASASRSFYKTSASESILFPLNRASPATLSTFQNNAPNTNNGGVQNNTSIEISPGQVLDLKWNLDSGVGGLSLQLSIRDSDENSHRTDSLKSTLSSYGVPENLLPQILESSGGDKDLALSLWKAMIQ